MAHSRLEKIGTIYTRITGLIRTGAMKLEDRPLWYEVYETFPPADPPRYDRRPADVNIRPIFYEEDKVRAMVHKRLGSSIPATNLYDTKNLTFSQRVINKTREQGPTLSEAAFEEAFESVKSDISLERETKESPLSTPKTLNMKNILS